MKEDKQPVRNFFAALSSIAGGCIGGICGFCVRSNLNSHEVIGFGNISEQIGKLVVWTCIGAGIFAGIGFLFGRKVDGK